MTIGLALQTALTGLQANQTRSAILARNIANATTAGYTRKDAVMTSLTVGGEGRGVTTANVSRRIDASLARETRSQSAAYQAEAAKADLLVQFTDFVGQSNEERSLSTAVAGLEQAFVGLEELPDSATQQRTVVDAAVTLAGRLNDTSKKVADIRQQADGSIAQSVGTVNTALKRMEELNRQVAIRTGTGQDTTELEDERDRLLDQIADEMGIQYFTRGDNEIVIMTTGGVTLLDSTARSLEFNQTMVIGPTAAYPGSLSGITVDGIDIAPGGGYPNPLRGGRLEGLFAVRDQVMPEVQTQIDEVAKALITGFQAADTTGGSLFTGTTAGPGVAAGIQVNSAVLLSAGGNPALVGKGLNYTGGSAVGDTTQIRAFIGVFSKAFSFSPAAGLMTSGTIKNFTNAAISQQQMTRSTAGSNAKSLNIQLETVKASREAAEGVNIDEELQDLMLLERSYAANAQIMQAAGKMLDKLLEI
ncbi:flagellar hook-associated protein FlgK [Oleisolibacter albus]|uniref:flagellar hook-associated protein FlgK n=1 Tax=Oleisolibacter albus TaxID=2171757 RepID=UPI000DF1DA38|nr:flagellar hook-associated protein FlgK [Oleisolibacter albus]